ncbi:hypothetical protein JZO66_02885 [Enterococcus sp. DIV0242_7C1]|uniref:KAP NTPase domain-containing protein n=2 Tax=Candidatus Enterococcus dunnyi TaxID=1834192 RepID=A0AAQ3Y2M2_9ENTE|nr:hypothetical protein [Enterococcus sp. DIV0242_7C1]MBO0469478.1 hypothetical protein [Enterococcus sp. DIV0242_7C1]
METVYFQDLKIDWSKAAKEFLFVEFDDSTELDKSGYLYKDQLKQLVSWVDYYNNLQCTKVSKVNNIFSIVGERGTGKSSFVKSAVDLFKNNKQKTNYSIYTLPIIDPTIFNGKLNILELFIAMLKKDIDCNPVNNQDNEHFKLLTKFNKIVKESVETLKNMRIKNSSFAEKNSSIEVLENIQKQQYFSKTITNLLKLFLELKSTNRTKYNFICLSIDDLDLVPNEFAYETLQLLEKFLNYQPNLYVLVALRREQLVNSVLSELISENENVLNKKLLSHPEISIEELRNQALNLIDKVLPLPQQVNLDFKLQIGIKDLLAPFIESEGQEKCLQFFDRYRESEERELSFQSFVQKMIMEQTRIQMEPVEKIEVTHYNYPTNLRSALRFLEFIYQFENYQQEIDRGKEVLECLDLLKKNVIRYRQYLLGTFKDNFSMELYSIISDWYGHEVEVRNSYLCNKLVYTLAKEDEVASFDSITKKAPTNVALGDVYTVLSFLREQHRDSNETQYLLYAIKMLYSLEMLELLLKSIILSENQGNEINQNFLQQYLCLARGKVMPDWFPYNESFISGATVLSYPYGVEEEENKKVVLNKILYSSVAAYGDIRTLPKKDNFFEGYWQTHIYRSRNQYKKSDFTKKTSYYIDLFAQLTDLERVEAKLLGIVKEQKVYYLFYSLFDLDFFVNKNYTRRSLSKKSERLEYSLKRVNDCFNNKRLSNIDERKLRRNMVSPLLKPEVINGSENEDLFLPLFENNEIKILKEVFEEFEVRENIDENGGKKVNLSLDDYDELAAIAISAINSSHVRVKRDFARAYYSAFGKWPKNMSLDQITRMNNFIKKERSQNFAELDNNLRLMNATINGHRSAYMQKQQEEV